MLKATRKPLGLLALALFAVVGCDSNPTAPSVPAITAGAAAAPAETPKIGAGKKAVSAPPVEQP